MKFNEKNTTERQMEQHPDAVSNYEGGLSFSTNPETELYMQAATCLVGEPKFYESAEFADQKLIQAIHRVLNSNPEFVLQLAVHCREQMHLRSVPLVLCAEYANVAPGTVPNVRKYISRVIQRADELSEIIAYQFKRNKISPRSSKLPMAIKHGVADAFPKFNAYTLGKYNREGVVTLRDALFLTHPKPDSDQQQQDWNNLVNDTLESPNTWETQRSGGFMTWADVIHNIFNKDGKTNNYMAQLRNLRNVIESTDVTNEDIMLVCMMISEPAAVRKSKQLPFRYLSAYRVIEKLVYSMKNEVLESLEKAASVSVENIPRMSGTTLIACDVSGSMTWEPISKNSTVFPYDIGIMLGSMAHRFCNNSIVGIFGTDWKEIPMAVNCGILGNVKKMHSHDRDVGWGTNGHKIIEHLLNNDIEVDRLMIFTDNQMWNSSRDGTFASKFLSYQRRYPNVRLYLFDLNGYGTIVVPEDTKNVCLIAGWSDRVFDFVQMYEGAGTSPIDKIKAITP